MRNLFINILNKVSRKAGSLSRLLNISLEERKASRYTDCYLTVKKLLRHHRPRIIYDIGANSGIWSSVLAAVDPKLEEDVLFEPQKKYASMLRKEGFLPHIKKDIFEVALGDKEASAEIKGGTACASFMDTNLENKDSFPMDIQDVSEKTVIKTLDGVREANSLAFPDTIKIDVQGYELKVLEGASETLKKTEYLVIELSFQELYIGQPKLSDIIRFLEETGFYLVEYGYEWRNKAGEIVQLDAIFSNGKRHKKT